MFIARGDFAMSLFGQKQMVLFGGFEGLDLEGQRAAEAAGEEWVKPDRDGDIDRHYKNDLWNYDVSTGRFRRYHLAKGAQPPPRR